MWVFPSLSCPSLCELFQSNVSLLNFDKSISITSSNNSSSTFLLLPWCLDVSLILLLSVSVSFYISCYHLSRRFFNLIFYFIHRLFFGCSYSTIYSTCCILYLCYSIFHTKFLFANDFLFCVFSYLSKYFLIVFFCSRCVPQISGYSGLWAPVHRYMWGWGLHSTVTGTVLRRAVYWAWAVSALVTLRGRGRRWALAQRISATSKLLISPVYWLSYEEVLLITASVFKQFLRMLSFYFTNYKWGTINSVYFKNKLHLLRKIQHTNKQKSWNSGFII